MGELKHRPSAGATWMNCPGSINAQEGLPDDAGTHAHHGSAAHALAEWSLQTGRDAGERAGDTLEAGGESFLVDDEMISAIRMYVDYCGDLDLDHAFIEQPVDFSQVIPGGTGRADFAGYRVADRALHVVDLKYGRGVPVDAVENEQLALYALGLWLMFRAVFDVERLVVHVVQPRRQHTSCAEYTVPQLVAFGQRAEAAYHASLQPDAPRTPSLKACRWCRARGSCLDLAASNIQLIHPDRMSEREPIEPFPAHAMDAEQLARVLEAEALISTWLSAVKEEARRRIQEGQHVPGFKLVQKFGNRSWIDQEAAIKALKRQGVKVADLYTKKLITPAQAEAAAHRAAKAKAEKAGKKPPTKKSVVSALDEHVQRAPLPEPSLVPDSAPGEAITPHQEFANAFADTE